MGDVEGRGRVVAVDGDVGAREHREAGRVELRLLPQLIGVRGEIVSLVALRAGLAGERVIEHAHQGFELRLFFQTRRVREPGTQRAGLHFLEADQVRQLIDARDRVGDWL